MITVQIVNWNCADLIDACLGSLRSHSPSRALELLVLDNDSRPDEKERMRAVAERHGARLIESPVNLGFGRGHNAAARQAQGEWIVILNPDIVVSSDVLTPLVEHLVAHPSTGLVSPRLLTPEGAIQSSWNVAENIVWEFAKTFYLQGIWRNALEKRQARLHGGDNSWEVGYVLGAFMIMRRAEFLGLGGFHESFFMNGEDVELCDRIRARGLGIRYFPGLAVVHDEGGTQRRDWSNYMRHRFQAFRLYIERRYTGWQRLVAIGLWHVSLALRTGIGFVVFRGNARTRLRGYLQAWRDPYGRHL
jgi:N-acetylglucosaminyl-diphospho-decaprenol L-rhamnosyltransferase